MNEYRVVELDINGNEIKEGERCKRSKSNTDNCVDCNTLENCKKPHREIHKLKVVLASAVIGHVVKVKDPVMANTFKFKKRRSDKILVIPETITVENYPTLQCRLRFNCFRKISDVELIRKLIAIEHTACVIKAANARLIRLKK